MKSTRQRILELAEQRLSVTPSELARALHVTPANIRHHLRKLTGEGLLEVSGLRPPTGRGRPEQLYRPVGVENNIPALTRHLLSLLQATVPNTPERLAASFAPEQGNPDRHITQRLVQAMQALQELNYRPRWEAHTGAPQIIFANCPFVPIIADHPELCHMDAAILERLLNTSVEQAEKLALNLEGAPYCRFVVGTASA